MTTRQDYNKTLVRAAESVLLEVLGVLGAFRRDMVVIGGLTPTLILRDAEEPHVGSLDVDIVVNHQTVDDSAYRKIRGLLLERGYEQSDFPFRFIRETTIDGIAYRVPVDFLAGIYGGTSKSHRHQHAGGIDLRKVRGADMALEAPLEIRIEGTLPEGGQDSATCRVVQPVLFIVLKAQALLDRRKEKDAYDVYYLIRHYPGGIDKLVEEFKPYLDKTVVIESIKILGEKFASLDHVGPKSVAEFEEIHDDVDRTILQRDVYERVAELLHKLDPAMD